MFHISVYQISLVVKVRRPQYRKYRKDIRKLITQEPIQEALFTQVILEKIRVW